MKSEINTEQVWQVLSDDLRTFFRRRVSDDNTAEELLQETFLRIHKNVTRISEEEKIAPWAFRIAKNLLTDHYRAVERAAKAMRQSLQVEYEEDENLNEVVAGWLPRMIEELPEGYRDAVKMYEIEGLPQKKIAEILNLSVSGAKSKIQRGRAKLLEILLKCCTLERDRFGNVIDYQQNVSCEGC